MDDFLAGSPQSVAGHHHLLQHGATRFVDQKRDNNDDTTGSISLTKFKELLPSVIEESKRLVAEGSGRYGSQEDPISKLFHCVDFSNHEWEPFALFDPVKDYTRNLIASDGKSYTLLLLCWNPGRTSPIHDHPCDGCWMKVCRGHVRECRYEYQESGKNNSTGSKPHLECIHDETYSEGDMAYIADYLGYHKVGNPTETTPAVTLHLYVPPISVCKIWMNEDCAPCSCNSTNYSEYGCILK